jgi:RpiR family transcriptional regulator, carbohydrate utilization regulator
MTKTAAPVLQNVPLAERLEHLSIKRQEIVRPILEHPREYVLLSVRALAKRLNTDPATVVRIVRGLGFESYKHFQRHLHELSLAFATSLDTFQQLDHTDGSRDPARESLMQDLKNLQAVKNSVDPGRLSALARRAYSARRIVIIAGDLASYMADYLGYQLNLLGLPVFVAVTPGNITHTIRALNKQDLFIAISFRRGLKYTVEGAQTAKQRGAYCIGITDTFLSPLGRICNEVFLASTNSLFFGSSYTAPIALANSMLTAIGEYRRSRTMEIVRELADEQRKGSRWYSA